MNEINNVTLLSDIEDAFNKGNLFKDLYDKYKFEVKDLHLKDDYKIAIYMLQVYTFASLELTLYLCNYEDEKLKDLLLRINSERKKIEDFIEIKYGALDSYSINEGFFKTLVPIGDNNVGI